jgi:glycosyltransferase involved in cell wall biosynthesis
MLFSILICSLQNRKDCLQNLLSTLEKQLPKTYRESLDEKDYLIEKFIAGNVEIIICTDNKTMSVGAKRNLLIKHAAGEYVAFIDDDDDVADTYIASILSKLQTRPDLVVFDAIRYVNCVFDRAVKYGIEYEDITKGAFYYRAPNHLMVIKKEHAQNVGFKNISFGEDADFARRVKPYLKKQERIPETLYHYLFDTEKTETQKHR